MCYVEKELASWVGGWEGLLFMNSIFLAFFVSYLFFVSLERSGSVGVLGLMDLLRKKKCNKVEEQKWRGGGGVG